MTILNNYLLIGINGFILLQAADGGVSHSPMGRFIEEKEMDIVILVIIGVGIALIVSAINKYKKR
ncbi:hypothetical protein M2451_000548 [Dysgonomonas sp. PFB1-18]|uniref:hypothetical protein n=1 Tax=unclassified Dysgonomonas TaxID=2630389 RepID=UPI002476B906|nr:MULTISPECIES: hypothetical protein [unclassified Dysgonomonas]MDH6307399.1 hypothetical protein [Dysgonomonas sp. PF1-14]MDH6337317.1 hypothetical protein [Dysgonomonas sp. PF1-16]MDH6379241.1 hypothetical protein [Dysgonomonas sp. PFB1-18]MDH6396121.1 hypothetical protein [Dysgonomonas sp. PF1-23]